METRGMRLGAGLGTAYIIGIFVIWSFTRQRRRIADLEKLLQHEEEKREADRKGRILAERALASQTRVSNERHGHSMQYIGWVESPFPDRRGTPRQPALVPAAHGRIKFDKRIVQKEAFAELTEFSHIFVVFVFHENTNIGKSCGNGHGEKRGLPSKIAPPRLGGRKVGCLTCRSPHRPNPLGLSVCEILGVGDDYIEISSIDFVDGTPVLDVKPVLPYDMIDIGGNQMRSLPIVKSANGEILPRRKLNVPAWIVEPDIPMRRVNFTEDAEESLRYLVEKRSVRFSRSVEQAKDLIVQCLRQDVRGVHQGRGKISNINETYMCRLDGMEISFLTTEGCVLVQSLRSAKK